MSKVLVFFALVFGGATGVLLRNFNLSLGEFVLIFALMIGFLGLLVFFDSYLDGSADESWKKELGFFLRNTAKIKHKLSENTQEIKRKKSEYSC